MDERIAKLAKAAAASLRGEEIDPLWLYDQSVLLLEQSSLCEKTNALWHTLVDASRALNDVGEYALAGEVFEMLLQQARARLYPKLEFDALEGLAESWFYIGDQNRAFRYLQTGKELAIRLNRKSTRERFEIAIESFREGKHASMSGPIKAPTNSKRMRKNRNSSVSSLLKKERNHF